MSDKPKQQELPNMPKPKQEWPKGWKEQAYVPPQGRYGVKLVKSQPEKK